MLGGMSSAPPAGLHRRFTRKLPARRLRVPAAARRAPRNVSGRSRGHRIFRTRLRERCVSPVTQGHEGRFNAAPGLRIGDARTLQPGTGPPSEAPDDRSSRAHAEAHLIWLTRLDGAQLLVNDEQITFVEQAGETVVSLANGDRLRVLESPEELTQRIVRWRRRVQGVALPGLEPEAP